MAAILCIGAFLTAERYSNLYILTSEGMALRAECVFADGARNDLEEYFTLSFLQSDPAMSDATYANYTITDYNYDLTIERISVLPWSMIGYGDRDRARFPQGQRSTRISWARIRTPRTIRCRHGRRSAIRSSSSTPTRAGISPS